MMDAMFGAQLENASYMAHSTAMLRQIAAAVGQRVTVRFVAEGN